MTENVNAGPDAIRGEQGLSDLIAAAAHDLTTPIFSILGLSQLLLDNRAPDDATRREFLTIIHSQAAQLARIVRGLRDLSALNGSSNISLEKEPVSVAELVSDVVARARPSAERREISLAMRVALELPALRTDRGRLTRILDNLIENALKYTKESGAVLVLAESSVPENVVRISVRDTGIGLSPDSLGRVFERGFQAAGPASDGMGLGLYICKQLATLLGGRIGATSIPGEGSTFWIEIEGDLASDGVNSR